MAAGPEARSRSSHRRMCVNATPPPADGRGVLAARAFPHVRTIRARFLLPERPRLPTRKKLLSPMVIEAEGQRAVVVPLLSLLRQR